MRTASTGQSSPQSVSTATPLTAQSSSAGAPAEPSLSLSAAAAHQEGRPALSPEMTTIHFGLENQSAQKTLYVYSDPDCPACRRFEPHLVSLAKDFSIYVLPVAYQSGSDEMARKILCASDKSAKWTEVMDVMSTDEHVTGNVCGQAEIGLRANMQAFDAMGFTQTPRVVSGTGYVFAAGATASDIRAQASLH